jgi:hypothetical protein
MRSKKKSPAKAHKVKSRGVWIAPDLERKIKGEGGRRGLVDPPYSYYLHLADLALKPDSPAPASSEANVTREPKGMVPGPLVEPPTLQTIASPPARLLPVRSAAFGSSLVDSIPAPLPLIAPPLILPKLQLPKPPRKSQPPPPPKLAATKLPGTPKHPKPPQAEARRRPKQSSRPKLSIPKPPKRG